MNKVFGSILVLAAFLTNACSGEDGGQPRPAASTETSVPVAPPVQGTNECEPGDQRECRYYYVTPDGRVLCPIKIQYCKADGSGWLPCGDGPEVDGTTDATAEEAT